MSFAHSSSLTAKLPSQLSVWSWNVQSSSRKPQPGTGLLVAKDAHPALPMPSSGNGAPLEGQLSRRECSSEAGPKKVVHPGHESEAIWSSIIAHVNGRWPVGQAPTVGWC